jgi:AhpD family alkylhydroperoxidase
VQLTDIDPALGLISEFGKLTKGTAGHIQMMRQAAIFTDGAISARLKTLGALLWSISARCEPCLKFYIHQAIRLGATQEEVGETLAVASAMGGCVGEMWALKAFKAYQDCCSGEVVEETEPSCCV